MKYIKHVEIPALLNKRRLRARRTRVSAIKNRRRNWLTTIAKGVVTILPFALSFTPLSSLKWLRYGPLRLIHKLIRYVNW